MLHNRKLSYVMPVVERLANRPIEKSGNQISRLEIQIGKDQFGIEHQHYSFEFISSILWGPRWKVREGTLVQYYSNWLDAKRRRFRRARKIQLSTFPRSTGVVLEC